MRRSRYFCTATLSVALVACIVAAAVQSQTYPVRPVRFIVPYPPGGSTDYTAREIAPRLSELWGHQLVIDNRGGAGSLIGHGLGATAPPDGYTLLLGTSTGLSTRPRWEPSLRTIHAKTWRRSGWLSTPRTCWSCMHRFRQAA